MSSTLPKECNFTHLCLIPKVTNPTKMTDLLPISPCLVHYKIIVKNLCSRLKVILPDLISDTQGGFVSERIISENIVIAHEMFHALRTNSLASFEYMAIKMDMSKENDRVEWCFLKNLIEKMGFDNQWIQWIMTCATTVTCSVLVNDVAHGFIKPERGIRQSDPLSPFLFIICAEALFHILNKSEAQGILHGVKADAAGPAVHHLLFADDSLLLCKAYGDESEDIKRCLKEYGEASEQMINYQK